MNITDLIQGAVASRTTRFAFELLPPLKGDGTRSVFGAIDPLMDFNPAYINVTFHREALKEDIRPDGSREWHIMRRRPGTVGISAAIRRKYDVEVVPHLICGGWSKYDIEDSLIDMDFLGLHNVLALRGDKRQNEPRFVPYAQGHAHAADLVRQIQAMNRGEFIDGEVEECHHSKFSVGVAGYPEKHFEAANPQSDLQYLKEKVDAGADYINIADSAGHMVPDDVRKRISALKDSISIPVGFHSHNNLGCAVANSLAAVEEGATYIDATCRGLGAGAGNTQSEVFCAVLDRLGYDTGVDIYALMDVAEKTRIAPPQPAAPAAQSPSAAQQGADKVSAAGVPPITVSQTTNISVSGASDANATATAIALQQDRVNDGVARNLRGVMIG